MKFQILDLMLKLRQAAVVSTNPTKSLKPQQLGVLKANRLQIRWESVDSRLLMDGKFLIFAIFGYQNLTTFHLQAAQFFKISTTVQFAIPIFGKNTTS